MNLREFPLTALCAVAGKEAGAMKMLPFSQHGNVPGVCGGVHHLDVFLICLL